jgi:molecular chaperone GrpE
MDKNDDTIQDAAESNSVEQENEKDTASNAVVDKDNREENESENGENEWEAKYKRALADYQNLEKRVADQRREWMLSASRDVLNRLLPILDTLILAQAHINDKGLSVSIQQFSDVLKSEGVIAIETVGKKFDPNVMEAVGTDEGDEGKVIHEARAGYMLNDKLLRPAQVIVGAGKEKRLGN